MPKYSTDAIRIVPPRSFVEQGTKSLAHPPPGTQMTYRNGPLLTSVNVRTIFWGAVWNGAQAALVGQLNAFFSFVVTSSLIDQLDEYSVQGQKIGHGSFGGTNTIADSEPGGSITDAEIQTFLSTHPVAKRAHRRLRSHPPSPAPNSNLVFLFLPPGTSVTMGGSASCTGFCGYHSHINGTRFYAVMPFPGCGGCTGGFSTFNALTLTSSHELCEAITDAIPGSGWYNDQLGEIGDVCAWKSKVLGAYTVQQEWSNAANRCV